MEDMQPLDWLREVASYLTPVDAFKRAVSDEVDDWQRDLLCATEPLVLALCSRGLGKSTTAAVKAWHCADTTPGATVILIARAERQSLELLNYVNAVRAKLPIAGPTPTDNKTELHLANASRIIALPGDNPDAIRAYRADLIIADEAARVRDEVITALVPMLKVNAQMICLTTPKGETGYFYEAWQGGWGRKIIAKSIQIPRMAKIVARDKKMMREADFRTEHLLAFQGSGDPFFSLSEIDAAFIDAAPLKLRCVHG